jgi:hypothetical protein
MACLVQAIKAYASVNFNAVLCRQCFQPARKHTIVVSILKPRNGPTLPSFCRRKSLLDAAGKIFQENPSRCGPPESKGAPGPLRDEQFAFRPRNSTTLQLARLVDRIKRAFEAKSVNDAGFLDAAKAVDTS